MRHGADHAEVVQQFDIGCTGGEIVAANHRRYRHPTKLAVACRIDMLVIARGSNVWGEFEIRQQLFLGGMEQRQLNVFMKRDVIDQQGQPAPGRFQALKRRSMQDCVHLGTQAPIQFPQQAINQQNGEGDATALFRQGAQQQCDVRVAHRIFTAVQRRKQPGGK
ncbi:hypothetical protein D3C75_1032810 [compost metagenome]